MRLDFKVYKYLENSQGGIAVVHVRQVHVPTSASEAVSAAGRGDCFAASRLAMTFSSFGVKPRLRDNPLNKQWKG